MPLQIISPRTGFALTCISCIVIGSAAHAEGGDTPGSGPVITGAQIQATITVTGDTSDNTDALDSGVVPISDCGADSAPDEWYTIVIGAATGTIRIDVDLCADNTEYDSKIFLMDTQGVVLGGCNDDNCGVVGGPSALLNVPLTPGTYELAIDGAGTASGPYTAQLREFICLACGCNWAPCSGTAEGEPCDELSPDTTNGGCNSTPNVFGSVTIGGPPICGINWANNDSRDTDWYAFSVDQTRAVEIAVIGQVDTTATVVLLSDGGTCPVIDVAEGAVGYSGGCGSTNIVSDVFVLEPGDYAMFVAPGNESGSPLFGGFPCPDGSISTNAYEVELRSAPLPCPWDLNANGSVDFADVLQIIANWGPCPVI
ncbi:MAG: hypothetical protein GY715_03890 [Planctomycetes bacterium]|nr:hypothetical protein [Planctomycetota bacterium]